MCALSGVKPTFVMVSICEMRLCVLMTLVFAADYGRAGKDGELMGMGRMMVVLIVVM